MSLWKSRRSSALKQRALPILRVLCPRFQVTVDLAKPLAGALVVGEHRGVEVQAHELADAAQLGLGIGDEVLVAQLHVAPGKLLPGALGGAHPLAPAAGVLLRVRMVRATLELRQADVPPVADEVHEVRLGQELGDPRYVQGVARALVAPARLVLARRVRGVERAHALGEVERLDRGEGRPHRVGVQPEVGPAPVGDQQLRESLAVGALVAGVQELRQELGLERHGELAVRVEHHPQQRRARARGPDHEGCGLAGFHAADARRGSLS